jgi:hypothetical protein
MWALEDFPGQRVLASARSEEQNVHGCVVVAAKLTRLPRRGNFAGKKFSAIAGHYEKMRFYRKAES